MSTSTKTFRTLPGNDVFETGGAPDGGLIRIAVDEPLTTDDPAVIAVLEAHGLHAVSADPVEPPAGKKSKNDDAPKGDD